MNVRAKSKRTIKDVRRDDLLGVVRRRGEVYEFEGGAETGSGQSGSEAGIDLSHQRRGPFFGTIAA
jgi:hypothetical protein